MILTRSPLRISLGGGGTDLPSYYSQFGGFLLAAAIDKYVYVTVSRPFTEGIVLKYSTIEKVFKVEEIQHPILRESIKSLGLKTPQIEVSTIADIPSGTGLGSSGSFTTALLKALYTHRKMTIHADELAKLACDIEIDILQEPIGKQDQYIASFGGIATFDFHKDGQVSVNPLKLSPDTMFDLEDNLLLFYTGTTRSASNILRDQDEKSKSGNIDMIDNLHKIKELGISSRDSLLDGDTKTFGLLMHEHWLTKIKRGSGISDHRINDLYEHGRANGAVGGKVVGAGGGGFLMFYANDRDRLRRTMKEMNLTELRFSFDFEGTKVVLS
jgi:D-glycero-alpha-D-manno-heptose-7-phosphate kinase